MIIKTTAILQNYVKIDQNINIETIQPFFSDAEEKYIIPYIGADLYEDLDDYVEGGETGDNDLDALLPYVRRALAKFTFFLSAPSLNINISEVGFTTSSTSQFAPASKERSGAFTNSMEMLGWDSLEVLLKYLEENKETYPLWTESNEYTLALRNFINSAVEFDKYVNIGKSRLMFSKLRNIMDNVEKLYVIPVIGSDLAAEIISQIKSASLSDTNLSIIENLRRAIANLSMSEYLADEEVKNKEYFKNNGENYLTQVRIYLDANYSNFPLYEAQIYDEDKTTYARYENTEDSKFFVGG